MDTDTTQSFRKEVATLGGGCEAVCMGSTGHAEVVQITFDPAVISYSEILKIFFAIHDPTTLNRQGNDAGTQYRSAIFYYSPEQKTIAEGVISTFMKDNVFDRPIVTEVVPAGQFYVAEDYHQEYFVSNPSQPYCSFLINPKLAKFRKQFAEKLKK